MPNNFLRRSWVEIDLEQIKKNYRIYKESTQSEIMAVVKADAYGHGSEKIASLLKAEGVNNFAVSNIDEAISLRECGIDGLILILGYTPIENLDLVLKHNITQALLSEEYADDVIKAGLKIKAHYAIDTGMNRIGLDADDLNNCKKAIVHASKHLNLTGLFTHLCVADTPSENEFTKDQIKKFEAVVYSVEELGLKENHCMNSAGGLFYGSKNFADFLGQSEKDYASELSCNSCNAFTRLGIVLYGLKPDFENILPKGIKPAMTWKSVISMIKDVNPGETIGYGRTYAAKNKMRVATIPTGYADGYNRGLSNKGFVIVNGKKAPIVGRVCMDQFMIDVTNIPDAKAYDEVLLLCDDFTADDMAKCLGTIGYEIICDISNRVERVYK